MDRSRGILIRFTVPSPPLAALGVVTIGLPPFKSFTFDHLTTYFKL